MLPITPVAARIAALLAALLVTGTALAQRPDTRSMTCAQAQSYVAARGAVVLSTGAHTYERFVAAPGYCTFGEYAYNASAPTQDTASCPLGYRCDSNPPLWDDRVFGPSRHPFF